MVRFLAAVVEITALMSRRFSLAFLVSVMLSTIVFVAAAGVQSRQGTTGDVLRSGVELVRMSATVVDEDGRLVGDPVSYTHLTLPTKA